MLTRFSELINVKLATKSVCCSVRPSLGARRDGCFAQLNWNISGLCLVSLHLCKIVLDYYSAKNNFHYTFPKLLLLPRGPKCKYELIYLSRLNIFTAFSQLIYLLWFLIKAYILIK